VGTARGVNRDQVVKIGRLSGIKNFVGKREKLTLNALSYVKPVETAENGNDMSTSTSNIVLNLLLYSFNCVEHRHSIATQTCLLLAVCCQRQRRLNASVALPPDMLDASSLRRSSWRSWKPHIAIRTAQQVAQLLLTQLTLFVVGKAFVSAHCGAMCQYARLVDSQ